MSFRTSSRNILELIVENATAFGNHVENTLNEFFYASDDWEINEAILKSFYHGVARSTFLSAASCHWINVRIVSVYVQRNIYL